MCTFLLPWLRHIVNQFLSGQQVNCIDQEGQKWAFRVSDRNVCPPSRALSTSLQLIYKAHLQQQCPIYNTSFILQSGPAMCHALLKSQSKESICLENLKISETRESHIQPSSFILCKITCICGRQVLCYLSQSKTIP